MREGLFWLDELQWSSIKGFLPGRKRRGPRRVDDRRVISGIVHVLRSCAGGIARKSTALSRRSITAGIAGRSRDCGKGCSMS